MSKLLFCWCLALSAVNFFLMGWDKRRSRGEGRRVPEKRFFFFALLGGALGGILGMYTFHHKTRHWYFKWGLPAILLLHLGLLWFAREYGVMLL